MKIALLTDCFFPNIGGAELVVHSLALNIEKSNHKVIVIAPKIKGVDKWRFPYKVDFFNPIIYKLVPSFIFSMIIKIKILRNKVDIINIHKSYIGFPLLKNKKLINRPIIVTTHGGDIQKYPSINYGKRLDYKWNKKITYVIKNADALIAISDETIQNYLNLGANISQIYKIPNGVDIDRFSIKTKFTMKLRKQFGINKNETLILSVGRYHIKKGYENLIDAMKIIIQKGFNYKLVIIGKGMEELENRIEALDIKSNVIIVQEQCSDLNKIEFPNDFLLACYQSANIFVSSSIVEGFALVCVEAMAAGLPIIMTHCPGNEDIFKGENYQFYFKVGNQQELASKVITIGQDKKLRKTIAQKCRKKALEEYNWKDITKKYIDIFQKFHEKSNRQIPSTKN